ncbi:hypothetical protein AMTRI_Chr01g133160 [Amborella trichopoda]
MRTRRNPHRAPNPPNPDPLMEADANEPSSPCASPLPESEPRPITQSPVTPTTIVPRKGGKKRKKLNREKMAAVQKKFEVLRVVLQPIPFTRSQTIDVEKHQSLFKRLGLYEFALLELDQTIDSEILAHFIAGYDPPNRLSLVKGVRVKVSRPELARALSLPVKSLKNPSDNSESTEKVSEEERAVLSELMSNWMFLHDDDTCMIMPDEMTKAEGFLREGEPEKINWANLVWAMAEKELLEWPKLEKCFYASHFQLLIKSQKPDLFKEEGAQEEELEAVKEGEIEEQAKEEEGALPEKLTDHADEERKEVAEPVNEENHEMDGDDHSEWPMDTHDAPGVSISDQCFKPCDLNRDLGLSKHNAGKELEDEPEIRVSLGLQSCKFSDLERMASAELMSSMENQMTFGLPSHIMNSTAGVENNGNLLHDSMPFPCKREMDDSPPIGPGESHMPFPCKRERDDSPRMAHGEPHKKMRMESHWDSITMDYNAMFDQAQCFLERCRMLHAEKEEAHANTQMRFEHELRQREYVIESLTRNKIEEQQNKEAEFRQLNFELYVVTNLARGYKKSLEDTRNAFAEYRRKCAQPEEPVYRDAGKGGVVLSTDELLKLQLERERERREILSSLKDKANSFLQEWESRSKLLLDLLDSKDDRLSRLVGEVRDLKDKLVKSCTMEVQ